MRIDSHQHFWHYSPIEHAWMSDEMGLLKRDFLPEDLAPLLKSIGLDGCIAVHSAAARKNGATKEEVAEALTIAISINAGAALVYSTRALDAFDTE